MPSPYLIAPAIALAAILAGGLAAADAVDTPQCRRDLTAANRLIQGIAAREKRFVPGDLAKNCQLLKLNLTDMVKAREPLDRCLKGHEHGETVAQMDAQATTSAPCSRKSARRETPLSGEARPSRGLP